MSVKLSDNDLLDNMNAYSVRELEENVLSLNKKIMLATQKLTAEFCAKYILDMDIDSGSEDSYIYDPDYIIHFQKHLTNEDIVHESNMLAREAEVSLFSNGCRNDPRIVELICRDHRHLRHEVMQSPCRFLCKVCRKKCVHGYTNPDHMPNPFGYLFLAPPMCVECSLSTSKCMWCPAGG